MLTNLKVIIDMEMIVSLEMLFVNDNIILSFKLNMLLISLDKCFAINT